MPQRSYSNDPGHFVCLQYVTVQVLRFSFLGLTACMYFGLLDSFKHLLQTESLNHSILGWYARGPSQKFKDLHHDPRSSSTASDRSQPNVQNSSRSLRSLERKNKKERKKTQPSRLTLLALLIRGHCSWRSST